MADTLTQQQRSHCMSKVKNKDTTLEVSLRRALYRSGLRYRKNVQGLVGRPDIVFFGARVAVFVDGDFWHGYRFKEWSHKLTERWKEKIAATIVRDRRNRRRLRAMGWTVVQIWEHDIIFDVERCIVRVKRATQRVALRNCRRHHA